MRPASLILCWHPCVGQNSIREGTSLPIQSSGASKQQTVRSPKRKALILESSISIPVEILEYDFPKDILTSYVQLTVFS